MTAEIIERRLTRDMSRRTTVHYFVAGSDMSACGSQTSYRSEPTMDDVTCRKCRASRFHDVTTASRSRTFLMKISIGDYPMDRAGQWGRVVDVEIVEGREMYVVEFIDGSLERVAIHRGQTPTPYKIKSLADGEVLS